MLDSLPGDCVTLKSTDVDLTGVQLNSAQLRALDSMRGAPPAALILKVGARVVVTRNLDVTQGIVNGTIGNVENIQPNLITVRRHKDGELMCIQPIKTPDKGEGHELHFNEGAISPDTGMGRDCPPCSGHDSEHKRFRLPGRHVFCHRSGLCCPQ